MFKVLDEVCEPTRGSKYSACVDVYAREDITIGAGETKLVGLGIKIDLEKLYKNWFCITERGIGNKTSWEVFLKSHYLQLMIRSSSVVKGLMIGNGVGVIDLDFPDEIKMIIHNPLSDIDEIGIRFGVKNRPRIEIKKGDKIAQITLLEHKSYLFGIDTDEERKGGFGSTGI